MKIKTSSEKNLHNNVIHKNYGEIREKNKFAVFYQNQRMKIMTDMVNNNAKEILDYCCGTCILYPHFKGDINYHGIDISKKMLKYGEKKYYKNDNFKTYVRSGEDLKFSNNKFDAALAKGALHHLPNPNKGLNEIHRVLAKDGILIISEPVGNFLIKFFRKLFYRLKKKNFSKLHKSFTKNEINELLKKNNFQIEKELRYGCISHLLSFPDILPFVKYIPFRIALLIFYLDALLVKIPLLNFFSLSLIIKAKRI